MNSRLNVTVVGAGPVGSLLAILLKRRGYDVDVFEKRSDPRQAGAAAGRSINLIITSRGIYGLEKAGLTALVRDLAVPVYGRMIHPKTGENFYQAYGQMNECNFSVSRAEINNSLIREAEAAGVRFHFDCSLEKLDTTNKSVTFSDGKQAHYALLFGADGSGSQLRKQLVSLHSEVIDTTAWLEADYKELTLPLGRDGKAKLKHDALHIWPRGAHMMMALANRDGSFTVTVYIPKNSSETKSEWGFEKLNSTADVERFFKSEFPDAPELMPNYGEEFVQNPRGHLGTVRCSRWVYENNIALLGDAAHAIVPFFGQGMNCGFEDCTRLLELAETHADDWQLILPEYQRLQKPNADAIADMALENWVEMKEKVADRKFQLAKKVESQLELRYPGLFKSRYGMITYTLIPYALAQQAGRVQSEMIANILDGVNSYDEISWEKAERLIESAWKPFVHAHKLKIENYVSSQLVGGAK